MSKYTKGPWKLHRIASDVVFVTEDRVARGEPIPAYNRTLVKMPEWSDANYEEKMANARLITAAPELLEALKKTKEHLDQYEITGEGDPCLPLDWIALAIAKAEGGEGSDEYYIQLAKDEHGSAVRDNSRADLIAMGKSIARGDGANE